MTLGVKLRYLREVEGTLRGLGREMTQQEIVRALKQETGKSISQSYLSQIESGARPHLTNSDSHAAREIFQSASWIPGGRSRRFSNRTDFRAWERWKTSWICGSSTAPSDSARDVDLNQALLAVAKHQDSRMCLVLLGAILENPGLAERLLQVLKSPAHERRPERRPSA